MGLGQYNFLFQQLSIAVIDQTTLNFHENAHEYPSLPLQHPPKPIESLRRCRQHISPKSQNM